MEETKQEPECKLGKEAFQWSEPYMKVAVWIGMLPACAGFIGACLGTGSLRTACIGMFAGLAVGIPAMLAMSRAIPEEGLTAKRYMAWGMGGLALGAALAAAVFFAAFFIAANFQA